MKRFFKFYIFLTLSLFTASYLSFSPSAQALNIGDLLKLKGRKIICSLLELDPLECTIERERERKEEHLSNPQPSDKNFELNLIKPERTDDLPLKD